MIRSSMFIEQKATRTRTPLLNYAERAMSETEYSDYAQLARKQRVYYLVLRTPELSNMIWDVAEDIVSRFDFVPVSGNGRNRIENARRWTKRVKFRDVLLQTVFDVLATGEGFDWLGEKASAIQDEINKIKDENLRNLAFDEAMVDPSFRNVASITMGVKHDNYNIKGYVQRLSGVENYYNAHEIIHLYFKRLPGRVEGFSQIMTMPIQIELLWLLWTNQHDLQAKGNMPDLIAVAKDIRSNSPALQHMEQKLAKYNMPGSSKHGVTVLYGSDYSFEKMERDTSLQFEDVGKAVAAVMAGMFRYPKHRMGIKTKEAASDKDTQGNSDRDYWDLVGKFQDKICDVYDSQLFERFFGVRLVFDKSYMHDDIVGNNAMQLRIGNIEKLNNMLLRHKEQISKEDIIRFVSGKTIDFKTEPASEDMMMMQMPGVGTPPKMKDQQLSAEKKLDAMQQQKNTGKPVGV